MRRVAFAAAVVACAIAWASGCSDDAAPPAPEVDAGPATPIPRPNTNDPQVIAGWQAAVVEACWQCHQSPDASDGVLSGAVAPIPGTQAWGSNLTPDPDTGLDAWDASTIADTMRNGVDDRGQPLCPTMPRYPDMKDDEAFAIAAYLRSLAAVHHYVPASVCPPIKPTEPDGDEDAGADAPSDG